MMIALLLLFVFWLAWSNGANDNFKGVATLYGSGTCDYRAALRWATVATVAGSLLSLLLAGRLAAVFNGNGLVPVELHGTAIPALSIAVAGALTIFGATLLGMPTSTTHALTGAIIGIAVVSGVTEKASGLLASHFVLPLALSPLLAMACTFIIYTGLNSARRQLGVTSRTCLCLGQTPQPEPVAIGHDGALLLQAPRNEIVVSDVALCVERYQGRLLGISAQGAVDAIHYASGGAVCFARAVNDTPKIAALLLLSGGTLPLWSLVLVAAAMAAGGVVNSRRVARTMSQRITGMNTGQGLTANLVTSGLVLAASFFAMPVSTTHVSCGSIFAIGLKRRLGGWGGANLNTISQIILTWLVTLPMGACFGGLMYFTLLRLGMKS